MGKQAKQYPENFKTMFGVSVMGAVQVAAMGVITGTLMLYITDYSGIYTGAAGKAAAVAAMMLLIGRIWDGINDPFLGFLMDRSPRTRWGRYKPFVFGGTIVSTLLLILLFNIPANLSDTLKIVWLYVFYFLFDSVFTLLPIYPLIQTLSHDTVVRSRLMTGFRIVTMVVSMAMSALLSVSIALGPDGKTPNIGLGLIVFMVPLTILSLIGTALVKEGDFSADEATVEAKDVLAVIKTNKPLWIRLLSSLIGGFTFSLIAAAQVYYIKYAFGPENLGTNSMIAGLILMATIILGTFLSQPLLKRFTPAESMIITYGMAVVPLVILWVINLAGPITNPAVFYTLLALTFLGIGMSYVPGIVMGMETMDYNRYRTEKTMQATIGAMGSFLEKVQAALSSALVGFMLVAVGYNAALYENAESIPAALFNGLGFLTFAMPALLSLIGAAILFWYPMRKKSQRDLVYAEIDRVKHEHEVQGIGAAPGPVSAD